MKITSRWLRDTKKKEKRLEIVNNHNKIIKKNSTDYE